MSRFSLSSLLLSASAGFLFTSCATDTKVSGEDTGLQMDTLDEDGDPGFDWPDDDQDNEGDDRDDDNTGASNMAPTIIITAPADGDVFETGEEITFLATVSDDHDGMSDIDIEWHSDVVGMLNDDPSGSTEIIFTTDDLDPGRHVISFEATDSEGAFSSSTVMITVEGENSGEDDEDDEDDTPIDPDDTDGDGWTIEEGDCDDNNWWAFPGAEEYCDGVDNDCDGNTDENFWDDYESNNVLGAAVDLGEIDYDGVTGERYAVDLAGLTLHEEGDEDWFRFDADDEYYDDIDITISYSGSADAVVIMQLYKLDWDSTVPWDEVIGSGTLELIEYGSTWDSGEDNWAIRILPFDAAGADCSVPYSLRIEA
jgi:hypothetical protein